MKRMYVSTNLDKNKIKNQGPVLVWKLYPTKIVQLGARTDDVQAVMSLTAMILYTFHKHFL